MAANLFGRTRPREEPPGECPGDRRLSGSPTGPPESRYRHRVEWGETDAAGILFYPNYFRWFDKATHEFFREIGYPITTMLSLGFAIPLLEVGANFSRALFYDDALEVVSTVEEIRRRTFRMRHRVFRGDELAGEGHEVRIWVRINEHPRQSLASTEIPPDVRALFSSQDQ